MHPSSWSASSDDIEIIALLRAISRHKVPIALLAIAAGIITYVGLTFVTPKYSSEAKILIGREENSYKRPAALQNTSEWVFQTDRAAVASHVQMLQSRDLAVGVVKALNLKEDPEFKKNPESRSFWRKLLSLARHERLPTEVKQQERVIDAFLARLKVNQLRDSRVIAVSFRSRNPETAARVANKIVDFYLTWLQNIKLKQRKEASAWLSAQITQLTKKAESADIKVERFRSSSGLFEGRNNATLDVQQLSSLNSQLIIAKTLRTEAEARVDLIKKMLKEEGDVAAASDVLNSQLIQRLLEQRVRVQRVLAVMSTSLMPSHPRLIQLNSQLADLRQQIAQESRKIVSSLQNEAQIAGAREVSLQKALSAIKRSTVTSNESQIKLRALEREATAIKELLESYLARYRDASARSDKTSVRAFASIISRAHVSNTPFSPKKGLISLLAFAAIGLLGLAYTVAREVIMAQHAGRLGTRDAGNPHADYLRGAQGPASRQTKHVTSAVAAKSPCDIARRLNAAGAGRIIITPASQRTEASRQALAVARALANAGTRLVVIDAMAEADHIATIMDLPEAPGIHQLLSGKAQFEQVIRRDPVSTLHVISGNSESGGVPALDDKKLISMLQALEATYDQIIVYTDPGQARILSNIPSRNNMALVLVAEASSTSVDALWIADKILADSHADPAVMLLRSSEEQRWRMPQFAAWKRAAAI